jgi:hypothetical protein|tara:strand:+ start:124 stop:405 length:282 start_codon:yes stop_codon:yes gene_type:complete
MQKNNLKIFFIKLFSIVVAIILIINTTYNIIFAEKIDKIIHVLSLSENKNEIKDKIRSEIKKGIKKDKILSDEDRELIQQLYNKVTNELKANK